MTVHSVTARSHPRLRPGNLNVAPRSNVIQFPDQIRLTPSQTKAARPALRKLAKLMVGTAFRLSILSPALQIAGMLVWNKFHPPAGFPGYENMTAGWRKPTIGDTHSPGDYAPNPFDHGSFDNPPESLLDTDDIIFPTGIRYWGDYGTNPYSSPYPASVPATNWPKRWVGTPFVGSPAISPTPHINPAYRPLRDLSPKVRSSPRYRPQNNIQIRLRLNGANVRKGTEVKFRENLPRKRDGDTKAKPANQFVFALLKGLANAGGETKEWIDILAAASGYIRNSKILPDRLRNTGLETQAKLWWVFVGGGINVIDWGELQDLVRYNVVEDIAYGALGKLSKSAAQSLGLTVGPQTGLVM